MQSTLTHTDVQPKFPEKSANWPRSEERIETKFSDKFNTNVQEIDGKEPLCQDDRNLIALNQAEICTAVASMW